MMAREFFKTTYAVEVLSDKKLGDVSLNDIAYLIDEGPCVGRVTEKPAELLTPKAMAAQLYEFGSDPAFFQLDDDGDEPED